MGLRLQPPLRDRLRRLRDPARTVKASGLWFRDFLAAAGLTRSAAAELDRSGPLVTPGDRSGRAPAGWTSGGGSAGCAGTRDAAPSAAELTPDFGQADLGRMDRADEGEPLQVLPGPAYVDLPGGSESRAGQDDLVEVQQVGDRDAAPWPGRTRTPRSAAAPLVVGGGRFGDPAAASHRRCSAAAAPARRPGPVARARVRRSVWARRALEAAPAAAPAWRPVDVKDHVTRSRPRSTTSRGTRRRWSPGPARTRWPCRRSRSPGSGDPAHPELADRRAGGVVLHHDRAARRGLLRVSSMSNSSQSVASSVRAEHLMADCPDVRRRPSRCPSVLRGPLRPM